MKPCLTDNEFKTLCDSKSYLKLYKGREMMKKK